MLEGTISIIGKTIPSTSALRKSDMLMNSLYFATVSMALSAGRGSAAEVW